MIKSGINIYLDEPIPELVGIVQQAEQLGFAKCWVYDEGLITRDPYVTLAAIAQKTSAIALGTGITNPYSRHPAVTAASIVSLDELSSGRAFLGLGAGGALTLDPLGIEIHKPLTAVRDMIVAARALFNGETVTHDGELFKHVSARIPYARPGIEIWLAGRGPKMLALGGEIADGVMLDFVYKEKLEDSIDLIRSGAKKSGNKVKICYGASIVTSEETLSEVRPHMTYRLVNTPLEVQERLGISSADIDAIRASMAESGLDEAGKLVKDEWVEPFVIMGNIDECAAELREIITRLNVDEFLVPILKTTSASRIMQETIEVLSLI